MRASRTNNKRSKRILKHSILFVFVLAIPIVATLFSHLLVDMFKIKSAAADFSNIGSAAENEAAFKHEANLTSKVYYTLNVVKNGNRELAGIFLTDEDLDRAEKKLISKKTDYKKDKVAIPSMALKYTDEDRVYIELVEAADRLFNEILVKESNLSAQFIINPQNNKEGLVEEIKQLGKDVEKYLQYSERLETSSSLDLLRQKHMEFLAGLKDSLLELEADLSYEFLQGSMLQQLDNYGAFLEVLSI